MSVVDYVRFLTALECGLIFPKGRVQTMLGSPGNGLGFDNASSGRAAGGYI